MKHIGKTKPLTIDPLFVQRTKTTVLAHYNQEFPAPPNISFVRILMGSLTGSLVVASFALFFLSTNRSSDMELTDLQADVNAVYIAEEEF